MAIDRAQPPSQHGWRRVVEWAVVAGVLLLMWSIFSRQVNTVQAKTELAAIQSTLGALRTALVLDYLQRKVTVTPAPARHNNPFELLERRPPNYQGELQVGPTALAPAGSWVFDPVCLCIGYRPSDAGWLDSPSGDPMVWFHVSGAPGPLQLDAKEDYAWQGAAMNLR